MLLQFFSTSGSQLKSGFGVVLIGLQLFFWKRDFKISTLHYITVQCSIYLQGRELYRSLEELRGEGLFH